MINTKKKIIILFISISMILCLDITILLKSPVVKETEKEESVNIDNDMSENDNKINIIRKYKNENNNNNNIKKNKINKELEQVPIAFAVDNNYIYPLIVLLTSILYNSSPKTYYSFHFLIPPDFLDINKEKIINLTKKYPLPKCNLKFYNFNNKYQGWSSGGQYTYTVYYRMALSDIIKDFDKIIYLDCDTMVHKDLTEFYNIKMGGYYYMGFPGHDLTSIVINGTRNFINSGVMLINLKQLRKINGSSLLEEYYYKYGTKKVDEYLINVVFYDKIKFLPFQYGIPDFEPSNKKIASPSVFWDNLLGYCNGTKEDMITAHKNRTITHGAYRSKKWWSREYRKQTDIGKKMDILCL